jgi:hypothetical protein
MNLFERAAAAAVIALLASSAAAQTAPSSNPAPAATSSAPVSGKPTKAKADPADRVICKEQEETGSRLGGHRVCHTKREWDRIAQDAGDLVNAATLTRDPGRPQ